MKSLLRFRRACVAGIAVVTLYAVAALADGPAPAGGLHGEFKVNASGHAAYSIPIPVPPGINGEAPHLRLSYSSVKDSGSLGVGWNLEGVSRITRCQPNLVQDGLRAAVTYGANDRFCLDGQRLIVTSGAYGADQSQYRTQVDSWRLVVASNSGSCGLGPCSFTVTDKLGRISVYGADPSGGQIAAQGRSDVRVWSLSSTTDLNGNQVSYTYTLDPLNTGSTTGAYFLSAINYTSNANTTAPAQANRSVSFVYETRPDTIQLYQGGSGIQQTARLWDIQTFVGTTMVQDYRISYGSGSPSLVSSIAACASADPGAACLPSTTFQWSPAVTEFNSVGTALSGQFGSSEGWGSPGERYVGDVNGDGLTDIVGFWTGSASLPAGIYVALSEGSTYQSTPALWSSDFVGTNWSPKQTPRMIADVNGDGLADIVGFRGDGVIVGLSNGTAFQSQALFSYFGSSTWNATDNPRVVADANGDGCADIVGFQNGVWVALSACDGTFAAPTQWTTSFTTGWSGDATPRLVMDIDGDGMSDVLGFGLSGVSVMISNGTAFATPAWVTGPSWPNGTFPYFGRNQGWGDTDVRSVADVNGDGLPDIVGINNAGAQVAINTGAGFLAPVSWSTDITAPADAEVVDVNGDGMADLVKFGLSGVTVALSNGSSFTTTSSFAVANFGRDQGWGGQTPRHVTDVNGDGLVDILGFGPSSVMAAIAQGPAPNLITQIADGFGGETQITYQPMSNGSVYSVTGGSQYAGGLGNASLATPAAYPVAKGGVHAAATKTLRGGVLQLVSGYTMYDGNPSLATTDSYQHTLQYTNAKIDLGGHGWQGFQTKTDTDVSTGAINVTTFHQQFPLTGQPVSVVQQCTSGAGLDPKCLTTGTVLNARNFTYYQTQTATGSVSPNPVVYFTPKETTRDDYYDYGTYGFSIASSYAYDTWGNRTLDAYLGYVDQTGNDLSPADNVYTLQQFYPPSGTNSWLLAYLQYKKVSTSSSSTGIATFVAGTDISLASLAYTTDGAMNLLSRSHWDDTNNAFLSYSYLYDPYGNRKQITDPAGNSTVLTYDTTYNTYKASKTTPADAGGTQLTTLYGYDPRFGKLSATTGPNGNTHTLCYDSFGRLSSRQAPVPGAPSGVIASTNCVSSLITGSSGFATAPVVTTETRAHELDASGQTCRVASRLAAWPTSTTTISSSKTDCLDGMRRHRSTSIPMNAGASKSVSNMTYDARNRLTSREMPHFTTDASPVSATMTYDAYGRLTQTQAPSGSDGTTIVTKTIGHSVTSDGFKATTTEAAGSSNPYVKVIDHRMVNGKPRVHSMLVAQDNNALTQFEHDLLGRRSGTTDPKGVVSAVTRDSLGRVATTSNPAHGTISFAYASTGVLNTKTDAKGATTYVFDALGRMLSKTFFDGSYATFGYDATTVTNGLGRMTSSGVYNAKNTVISSKTTGYDANGKVAAETVSVSGQTITSSYVNNPDRSLWQLTYPDSTVLTRGRNATGELSTLALGATTYATYTDYSPGGMPRTVTYGNGLIERRSYWPAGQQGSFEVKDSADTVLYDETYDWDELGLLHSTADGVKYKGVDLSQSFGYTSMRLTSATAAGTYGALGYQYDNGGNLTALEFPNASDNLTFTYYPNSESSSSQQVESATNAGNTTVFSATYDALGNTETLLDNTNNQSGLATTWTLTYDPQDRMTQASTTANKVTTSTNFTYDARGTRLTKTGPDGTTTIHASPYYDFVLLPGGGTKTVKHLGGGRAPVASIVTPSTGSSATTYFHRDYRGSIVATSDPASPATALATRVIYDPLGSVYSIGGPDNFDRKFAGLSLDQETGLYDHGSRYFDSNLGRFLRSDTGLGAHWTRQDSQNRYAYALNAATSLADANGRSACMFIGMAINAVVAGAAVGTATGVGLRASNVPDATTGGVSFLAAVAAGAGAFFGTQGGVQAICDAFSDAATTAATTGGTAAATTGTTVGTMTTTPTATAPAVAWASPADETFAFARTFSSVDMDALSLDGEGTEMASVSSPMSTCSCFTADTLVSTSAGLKAIGSIDAGETVWSAEPKSKPVSEQVVRRTVDGRVAKELVLVSAAGHVIRATPEHPFWEVGRSDWVPAGQLKAGDRLLSRKGEAIAVSGVEKVAGDFKVYNFEVRNTHTYYVSEAEVLVHNLSCLGEETDVGGETELGSGEAAASSEAAASAEADAATAAIEAADTATVAADASAGGAGAASAGTAVAAGAAATAETAGVIAAETAAAAAAAEASAELIELLPALLAL